MEMNATARWSRTLHNANIHISSNTLMFLNLSSRISVRCDHNTARCRLSTSSTSLTKEESAKAPAKSVARRLILLCHAHRSWDNPLLCDPDRPLSKAGIADAAKVSLNLQQLGWIPQLILSSDATRTRETLKIMQEQVPDFLDAEVHFIPSFYSIADLDGQTAEYLQLTICRYSRVEFVTVMHLHHQQDLMGGSFKAL